MHRSRVQRLRRQAPRAQARCRLRDFEVDAAAHAAARLIVHVRVICVLGEREAHQSAGPAGVDVRPGDVGERGRFVLRSKAL